MINSNNKKIAISVIFSLLCIYYLILNFSKFGCIATTLSVILIFVQVFFSDIKGKKGVIGSLGCILGVSVFNYILVSFFSMEVNIADLPRLLDWGEIGLAISVAIILIVFSTAPSVLEFFSEFSELGSVAILSVLKYALIGVAAFYGMERNIYFDEVSLIYILTAYAVVFMFAEYMYIAVFNKENPVQFYAWAEINLVVLYFASICFPYETENLLERLSDLEKVEWTWYSMVVAFLAFLAIFMLDDEITDDLVKKIDKKLCYAAMLDYAAILSFVKNSLLMAILLVIANVVFLSVNSESKGSETKESFYLLGAIILMGILWSGHVNDMLIPAIIGVASVICGVFIFKRKNSKTGMMFWIYVIAAMSVMAYVLNQGMNDIDTKTIIIINVAAIATAATAVLNQKNRVNPDGAVYSKAFVSVCAFLMLLFSVVF